MKTKSNGQTERTTIKTNRKISGLDKFLKESLSEDPQFKALFKKELKKIPAANARRAVRRLGLNCLLLVKS
jgi:hypothetical protein